MTVTWISKATAGFFGKCLAWKANCPFTISAFTRCLDKTDLISFDIFDTLITRISLQPDSILHFLEKKLQTEFPNALHYFRYRKAAENNARVARNYVGDVSLDEIYSSFTNESGWSSVAVLRALALEKAIDRTLLRPREATVRALIIARDRGKRVIAISDTYYQASTVSSFLEATNIAKLLDAIYVSSEQNARKDRGDLWEVVLKQEQVAPRRWLHIGDNVHSDIQLAQAKGIKTLHVLSPKAFIEAHGFSIQTRSDKSDWLGDLLCGPSAVLLASPPYDNGSHHEPILLSDAYDFGYALAAPILMQFIAWLISHPRLRSVEHAYFLSRDGFLLHKLYEMTRISFPHLLIPPSTYFHISRSIAIAAGQAVSFDPAQIISGSSFRGDLASLLKARLGLYLPDECPSAKMPVVLPLDAETVISLISDLKPLITAHARQVRNLFVEYAHQVKINSSGSYATIDVGYSGTIQKGMQKALGIPISGFYLYTTERAKQVEADGGVAFRCFDDNSIVRHSRALFESILSSSGGQATGYIWNVGRIEAVCKTSHLSRRQAAMLQHMQNGILNYFSEMLDSYGSKLLTEEIRSDMPQEFFRMLIAGKLRLTEELASLLSLEDDFTGSGILPAAGALTG